MDQNLCTFIKDFKASGLIDSIQKEYNVVMIWITGSRAIDLVDPCSDYDIGILISDDVKMPKEQGYSMFAKYVPDNEANVHFRVNTLRDLCSLPSADLFVFYDYLGFAQLQYFTEEHILYLNPEYADLIQEIQLEKSNLSNKAATAFLTHFRALVEALAAKDYKNFIGGKTLMYLCWCAELLLNKSSGKDYFLGIKKQNLALLSDRQLAAISQLMSEVLVQLPKEPLYEFSFKTLTKSL